MASASSTKKEIGRYLIETDESKALGRGNYDVLVFKGKHVLANYEVAAKRYQVGKGYPEALDAFGEEGELMREIPPHPNTIHLFDCVQTDGINSKGEEVFELWLILEYCDLGDLRNFANKTEKDISLSQKVDLMIQSARGLQHLHKCNLLHRDLKPANLLVAGTEDKPVIKLADMGESKFVVGTLHTLHKGTPPFMAPELNKSAYYDKSVDTYALGCTCYALLEHRKGKDMIPKVEGQFICTYLRAHPSADLAALIIKEDDSNTEAELKRLFSTMMAFDPTTRPSIQHVIDSLSDIQTSLAHSTSPEEEAHPSSMQPEERLAGAVGKESNKDARTSDVLAIQDINWSTAKITLRGAINMPAKTNWIVSFGRCGEVVVNDGSHISLYRNTASTTSSSSTPSSSSSSHILAQKIPLPDDVMGDCQKAVTGDALYVQKYDNAPTHQLSITKPHRQNTLHHSGTLRGAIDEALVYRHINLSDGNYIIHIHRASGEVILKPPSAYKWGGALSVCSTGRFYAVTEWLTYCLDVFSSNGEHVQHTDLKYWPHTYSGISQCSSSHVMVADGNSPVLHIHHLPGGEEVRIISREELGLGKGHYVNGVNYNNGLITLAVGKRYNPDSLRTYKVLFS